MITLKNIMSIPKSDLQEVSKNLSNSDIPQLVGLSLYNGVKRKIS